MGAWPRKVREGSLSCGSNVSLQKGPETKKAEILVLDPKRSNAINIGMTVLPALHVIKSAILSFDEFAISKEGIEVCRSLTPPAGFCCMGSGPNPSVS